MVQLQTEKSALSNQAFQSVTESQNALAQLQSKETEFKATDRADSPVMQRLRDSIETARADVNRRPTDLRAGSTNKGVLGPKVVNINKRIAYLEDNHSQYEALQQQVKLDQDNDKYYQQASNAAHTADTLNAQNITRVSSLDAPTAPSSPETSRRNLILIAILMTATLFGFGTGLVFEMLDGKVAYPEQIAAAVGLPVLASF